jgi:hypothetical protein
LQQGSGRNFIHWVPLFDQLDDDLFFGELGEDEKDTPRLLIEYQIVNSKYTAAI